MATVRQIAQIIEELFPPENVCMEDFIGLSVGSYDAEASKAIVCLDCTEDVVNEAIEKGASLIVSHHPLIFGSVSEVTDATPTGRIIMSCARHGISVFSAHTNMDCSVGGINEFVAKRLGLKNAEVLVKNQNQEVGVGQIGDVEPIRLSELAKVVAKELNDDYVKPYGKDRIITKVAVINGSGGDIYYIDQAKCKGATCFVTSEIKHHVALYAVAQGVNLIETGHYASEKVYVNTLSDTFNRKAQEKNLRMQFITSESESNPAL